MRPISIASVLWPWLVIASACAGDLPDHIASPNAALSLGPTSGSVIVSYHPGRTSVLTAINLDRRETTGLLAVDQRGEFAVRWLSDDKLQATFVVEGQTCADARTVVVDLDAAQRDRAIQSKGVRGHRRTGGADLSVHPFVNRDLPAMLLDWGDLDRRRWPGLREVETTADGCKTARTGTRSGPVVHSDAPMIALGRTATGQMLWSDPSRPAAIYARIDDHLELFHVGVQPLTAASLSPSGRQLISLTFGESEFFVDHSLGARLRHRQSVTGNRHQWVDQSDQRLLSRANDVFWSNDDESLLLVEEARPWLDGFENHSTSRPRLTMAAVGHISPSEVAGLAFLGVGVMNDRTDDLRADCRWHRQPSADSMLTRIECQGSARQWRDSLSSESDNRRAGRLEEITSWMMSVVR